MGAIAATESARDLVTQHGEPFAARVPVLENGREDAASAFEAMDATIDTLFWVGEKLVLLQKHLEGA